MVRAYFPLEDHNIITERRNRINNKMNKHINELKLILKLGKIMLFNPFLVRTRLSIMV